ncbi:hypothetical protein CGCA056_v015008 [Colletotrichum aenigma]|uniref:uncharacterized protein n=1 Tax=Colletotrichum aenigma TaxID=1215731 RepID=UPI00187217F2|nr:uncharacterized protein CGCA056_v015008 [Colletotrichum aenigma]KAF5498154.1 hypothetical protein CGCA056_v015008 [Colletotrichum aenigma]
MATDPTTTPRHGALHVPTNPTVPTSLATSGCIPPISQHCSSVPCGEQSTNPRDCYWCVLPKYKTSRLRVYLGYLGWIALPPGRPRHQQSNRAWSYLESGPSWLTRISPRH